MRGRFAGGFTLIEVLVAVLLLAIGIIGALGLQMAALRTRQGSSQMSRGVQLASSLAERMRANAAQMQQDDARNPYLQLRYEAGEGAAPPVAGECYGAGRCDSAQLARFDMAETIAALHAGFAGGRIAVCRDGAVWDDGAQALSWQCGGGAGAPIVIKIGWRGKRADGADEAGTGKQAAPSVAIMLGTGAE